MYQKLHKGTIPSTTTDTEVAYNTNTKLLYLRHVAPGGRAGAWLEIDRLLAVNILEIRVDQLDALIREIPPTEIPTV